MHIPDNGILGIRRVRLLADYWRVIAFGAFLIVAAWIASAVASHRKFEISYERIQNHMSITEVESILGPGQKMDMADGPRSPDGPILSGDTLYHWNDEETYRGIWVGFKDGRVLSKYYWEPSF